MHGPSVTSLLVGESMGAAFQTARPIAGGCSVIDPSGFIAAVRAAP